MERARKFLKGLLISLSVVMMLVVALVLLSPSIAIKVAQHWYAQQGEGYQLSVDDWSLSFMTPSIELKGITLSHPEVGAGSTKLARASVDVGLFAPLRRALILSAVEVEGLQLDSFLQNEDLYVAGIFIPLSSEAKDEHAHPDNQPDIYEVELSESDDQVPTIQDSTSKTPWLLLVEQLTLRDIEFAAQVRDHPSIALLNTKVVIEHLSVTNIDSLGLVASNTALSLTIAEFNLQDDLGLRLDKPWQVQLTGQAEQWLHNPSWQGGLELSPLVLSLSDGTHINVGEFVFDGIKVSGAAQTIKQGTVHDVMVTLPSLPTLVISQLELSDIDMDGVRQRLGSMDVSQLHIGDEDNPLVSLAHYQVNDLQLEGRQAAIGLQYLQALSIKLVRDAQGNIQGFSVPSASGNPSDSITDELQASADTASQEESSSAEQVNEPLGNRLSANESSESNAAQSSPFTLTLQGVQQGVMNADEDLEEADSEAQEAPLPSSAISQLQFSDFSIKPALQTTLSLHELSIEQATIEFAEVPTVTQPIRIQALLGLDAFNRIQLDSTLALFEKEGQLYPQGDIRVRIKQLNLVPFNGYLIDAMGYQLERGMLDAELDLTIDQGELNGELRLLLRNSRFVPANQRAIERFSQRIAMPVETALSLLRDRNGNLRLAVPLTGNVSDPNFGLSDLTNQLSRLAVRTTALHFLLQTMQPYGLLIALTTYAGSELLSVRLDAIEFEQGSASLEERHISHLERVAEVMREKDRIELRICPFVSKKEAEQAGDNWRDLADQRGKTIRQWLAQQKDRKDRSLGERASVCMAQQGERAEVVVGFN